MIDFNQNQIKILKGNYAIIARSCGVTTEYVKLVLTGKRETKSLKAQEIVKKALGIVEILNN